MNIISFYEGKSLDYKGRSLDDILSMTDNDLEECHDFIQVLFPNREPSSFNPKAPLLDDETVEHFKRRADLKKVVKLILNRMISFYDMGAEYPWWCTKHNHNYLRCTRILNTLREFGMKQELDMFYTRLLVIAKNNSEVITSETVSYWEDAYLGERDYLINVTVTAKVSATRGVDLRASSLKEAKRLAIEQVKENVIFTGDRDYEMSDEEQEFISFEAEEE
jgi:hypothetical protein